MGHKVSRHKSYAVCRIDGLPGQYRVIRPADSYDSHQDKSAISNDRKSPNHDPGVTADRKYVTAINDIGSKGIRSHGGEIKSNGVIPHESKPKPKPRKSVLPNQEQHHPSKSKESPKKARDSAERKSNGSTSKANAITHQKAAQNGHDSKLNGTVVHERPQRVVPRASYSEDDDRRQKANPRVNTSLADERKQKTLAPANSKADNAKQQRDTSHVHQHQHVSNSRFQDTKSVDDDPIPITNVDSLEVNKVSQKSRHVVEITPNGFSADAKPHHESQTNLSLISTTSQNNSISSDGVAEDQNRFTLVSVVVHQPFAKPEPGDVPEVVLNDGKECVSYQKETEQEDQVTMDDEPVDVAMFERECSTRSSTVKKSVAFSDDCVDIEYDLSQSRSRNGFHEKMDTVYGTTARQNNGDKWVTLDATDATDFALIQRQKVPGQSILKKSKHPSNNSPLDLKESSNKNVESKINHKKTDIAWDHIEDPSNPYPNGMVPIPVPVPRGRMKGYHRPQSEEMSKIKASNGTLADYIKEKSTNTYQATRGLHTSPTQNGIIHSTATQTNGRRPQSSRGHAGEFSSRSMTSPRSSSADPRSRALSPSRNDTRGLVLMPDGHVRKIANGFDPAVHYVHSPRGEDNLESRQRQSYTSKQQNFKLVVSSGKQKSSHKKQYKQILEHPKQQRNMMRQQWMVGNL